MYNRTHFGFDWGELITGVALIITSILLWRNPGAGVLALTFIFALVAIIRGIATLAGGIKLRDFTGALSWVAIAAGVLDIIVGIIFMFNLVAGAVSLGFLFAIWFLADSIGDLANVGHLREAGTGWMIMGIVFDVFGIIIGIMLMMQPVVAAVGLISLLAIYFMIFGIGNIVIAFARRNI